MDDRFDEVLAELRSDRAVMRRELAAWSAHIDRLQEQTDEHIRFLRELNRGGERALQELVRSQGAMREEIRAHHGDDAGALARDLRPDRPPRGRGRALAGT